MLSMSMAIICSILTNMQNDDLLTIDLLDERRHPTIIPIEGRSVGEDVPDEEDIFAFLSALFSAADKTSEAGIITMVEIQKRSI